VLGTVRNAKQNDDKVFFGDCGQTFSFMRKYELQIIENAEET
jgi:hypothetical protein